MCDRWTFGYLHAKSYGRIRDHWSVVDLDTKSYVKVKDNWTVVDLDTQGYAKLSDHWTVADLDTKSYLLNVKTAYCELRIDKWNVKDNFCIIYTIYKYIYI